MDKKGVTLIELLIVVAIIGVLAAISVPLYTGQQKKAKRAEGYSNLEAIRLLQEQYYADNGEYAPNSAASTSTSSTTLLYDDTYNTSSNPTDDRNIIKFLPGFKPGNPQSMYYYYEIEFTVANSNTTGFTAHAKGRTGTSVSGDDFWVNENNSKNY